MAKVNPYHHLLAQSKREMAIKILALTKSRDHYVAKTKKLQKEVDFLEQMIIFLRNEQPNLSTPELMEAITTARKKADEIPDEETNLKEKR